MHQVVHVWPYLKRKYLLFISIIVFKIQYRQIMRADDQVLSLPTPKKKIECKQSIRIL